MTRRRRLVLALPCRPAGHQCCRVAARLIVTNTVVGAGSLVVGGAVGAVKVTGKAVGHNRRRGGRSLPRSRLTRPNRAGRRVAACPAL